MSPKNWPRATTVPATATLLHRAIEHPDYRDAFTARLPEGTHTDPAQWLSEIFFHRPFPGRGNTGTEALIGETLPQLRFATSLLIADGRMTMSNAVAFRNRYGPGYFAVVKPFHRLFVRVMLWCAIRAERRRAARTTAAS